MVEAFNVNYGSNKSIDVARIPKTFRFQIVEWRSALKRHFLFKLWIFKWPPFWSVFQCWLEILTFFGHSTLNHCYNYNGDLNNEHLNNKNIRIIKFNLSSIQISCISSGSLLVRPSFKYWSGIQMVVWIQTNFFMLVLLVEYIFLTTFYGLYFNHQPHTTLNNFFKIRWYLFCYLHHNFQS